MARKTTTLTRYRAAVAPVRKDGTRGKAVLMDVFAKDADHARRIAEIRYCSARSFMRGRVVLRCEVRAKGQVIV